MLLSVANSGNYLHDNNEDAERHYHKVIGECDSIDWGACESYPGLYHFIAGLFVNGKGDFLLFNILMMIVVLPLVLFWYSKNIYVPIFYFIGTNLSVIPFSGGTYPSFFILIFWVIFLKTDKDWLKVVLLILSIFIHNAGVYLFLITWLLQGIFANGKNNFSPIVLGFTGGINRLAVNVNSYIDGFFLSMFPLFSVLGLMKLIKQHRIDLIMIVIISLTWSLVNIRAIYPAVIILLFSFSDYFRDSNLYVKVLLLIGALGYLAVSFYGFTRGFGGFLS